MKFSENDSGITMPADVALKIKVHDQSADLIEMIKRVRLYENVLDEKVLGKIKADIQDKARAMFTNDTIEAVKNAAAERAFNAANRRPNIVDGFEIND